MRAILGVEGQNFLSYQKFEVVFGRGTELVTGQNGTGKSAAIVEAPMWCFFGITVRGLSGDEVVFDPERSGKGKNCHVTTRLTDAKVTRYRKDKQGKNEVEIEWPDGRVERGPAKVIDPKIAQLLGVSLETFQVTSIFGQGQMARFSTGNDAERKAVLDEMLGIGVYARAREQASARLRELDAAQTTTRAKIDQTTGLIARFQRELETLQADSASWSAKQAQTIQQEERALATVQEQLAALPEPLNAAQAADREATTKARLQELQAQKDRDLAGARLEAATRKAEIEQQTLRCQMFERELQRRVAKRDEANGIRQRLEEDVRRPEALAETELTRLEQLEQPIIHHCPTCKVDLQAAAAAGLTDTSVLDRLRAARMKDLSQQQGRVDELAQQLETCLQRLEEPHPELPDDAAIRQNELECRGAREALRVLQQYQQEHPFRDAWPRDDELLQAARDAETAIRDRKAGEARVFEQHQQRTRVQEMVNRIACRLEAARRTENPYTREIASTEGKLGRWREELTAAEAEVQKGACEREDLAFWVTGFGPAGIRSLLLDELLPALNQAARRFAHALSGGRLTVRFDTEATLKSGEVRDRFEPIVQLDHGAGSYKGLSGGWKRRVDLVQLLALRAAAANLRGGLDLLVLDEPFENLDDLGVEAALELVQEVSRDLSSVYLVTHNQELQSRFPRRLQVTAQNGVSTIQEG
jgi:DNA repair exonuclease SbcCD ATPase subunit